MKFFVILPVLLAFAHTATCGVVNGGVATVLTPPITAHYATGYGSSFDGNKNTVGHLVNGNLGFASSLHHLQSGTSHGIHGLGVLGTGYNVANIGSGLIATGGSGLGLSSGAIVGGIGGLSLGVGSGSVASGGTTISQNTQQIAIPIPQPVPVVVNRPVAVPVAVPRPVEVPRPVRVEVPHPVKVEVSRPYPVNVPRPVPVPVHHPVYVNVPRPVPVPVAQPYPVVVPRPVPVSSVPSRIEIPVGVGAVQQTTLLGGISGGFNGGHGLIHLDGSYVNAGTGYATGHSNYITGSTFSGSGGFTNVGTNSHHHHHHSHGSGGQLYDSNGGYKY